MHFDHIINHVCSMGEKHAILERVRVRDVFPFSWRVFATWDFSVTSKSGVITKHKVLLREFNVCNYLILTVRLVYCTICIFLVWT